MASVQSPLRTWIKPLLFRLIGKKGYFWAQVYAKSRDIQKQLVEEEEMTLLPSLIKAGDEVIDIGANFAYYSVRMAKLVGAGKVYAFEPIPFTYQVAKRILKQFNLNQVDLYQLGVGEDTEIRTFQVPLQDFGAISAGQAHFSNRNNEHFANEPIYQFHKHEKFECKVVKLDEFLLPFLTRLSFVKIDIEGAELFALKGMKNTLRQFRPTILIEIEPSFLKGFEIKEKSLTDVIFDLDYEIFAYDGKKEKLQAVTPPLSGRNYILLPREKLSHYQALLDPI